MSEVTHLLAPNLTLKRNINKDGIMSSRGYVATHRLSLVVASGSYSLVAMYGLLIAWLLLLWSTGSQGHWLRW